MGAMRAYSRNCISTVAWPPGDILGRRGAAGRYFSWLSSALWTSNARTPKYTRWTSFAHIQELTLGKTSCGREELTKITAIHRITGRMYFTEYLSIVPHSNKIRGQLL